MPTPNWLDRVIAYLSPQTGFRREAARALLTHTRTYEAAKRGRRTEGWFAHGTSANAEIASSLFTLRNRSRQLVRDNAYAASAIERLTANAVGTGIQARVPDGAKPAWQRWVQHADYFGELDLYGLQALAARAVFESGEVLLRRVYTRPEFDGDIGLRLQVIECDHLDTTKHGALGGGHYAIAGIEFDASGRRVAYWIYDQHPGDTIPMVRKGWTSTRVPAADVRHVFEKRRPSQVLGVPRLASALLRLRDLDDYEDAELVRKKIEACYVAFVRTQNPGKTLGEASADPATNQRVEGMAPGMIEYLLEGEEVTFGNPSASTGYGDFTATQLRAVAVAAGVTYEQLTGDYSRVNYSSARAALLEFRRLVEQFRWLTFVPMFCGPTWEWFVESAYAGGSLRSPNYQVIEWTPPRWEWVDPLKDVQAVREELDLGLTSLPEEQRARGYDPEALLDEIAESQQKIKDKGIALNVKAAAPAKPDPEDATPKPDDEGDTNDAKP